MLRSLVVRILGGGSLFVDLDGCARCASRLWCDLACRTARGGRRRVPAIILMLRIVVVVADLE